MSDHKFWDVFRDPLWLLHNLYKKYKVITIPINGGYSLSNVNGGVSQTTGYLMVNTSVTALSRGMAYFLPHGLNSGTIYQHRVDWTKRLELSFIVSRANSDVQVVARVQLKELATEGALGERGIGIEINNYSMNGEAYGTARDTVAIGALTDLLIARVRIVLTSASVEFWVNGVLQGTLTGTAIPNIAGTVNANMVISIINGAAGGVNAQEVISNIQIIQAW